MAFDIQGARAAGYSDDEIADHLATLKGIDVAAARKSGWDTPSLMAELEPLFSGSSAKRDLPKGVTPSEGRSARPGGQRDPRRIDPPESRNPFAVVNDTVIEAANAVAGGLGSAANFISPGNRVSQFIDERIIKPGEASQSDLVQAEKARFRQEVADADTIGGEVGATLGYIGRNPLQAAAQAAGSFALPAGAVRGAGGLAAALGAGARGTARAGLAGGAIAGGAMSGGDAAGTAYELVKRAGGTEDQARDAARKASMIPAAVGAAGGVVGAERLLAGAKGFGGNAAARAAKTGAVEGAQEAAEEGITQYAGQRAAVPFDPSIDPTKGVASAATMGGALGAATGAGTGLLTASPWQRPQVAALKIDPPLAADPPEQQRAKMMAAFDRSAAVVGMSPKALAAVRERSAMVPLDQLGTFLARSADALTKRGLGGQMPPELLEALATGPLADQAPQAVDNIVGTLRQAGALPQDAIPAADLVDGQDFTGLDAAATQAATAQPGASLDRLRDSPLSRNPRDEVLPVGDATEIDPIPVGQATEMIPTADATELEAIPTGDATEISPEVIQADDIMASDGEPFTSRTSAAAKAYSNGGGEVVRIPNHFGDGKPGFVVRPIVEARPTGTRGTDARDIAQRVQPAAAPDMAADTNRGANDGQGQEGRRQEVLTAPAANMPPDQTLQPVQGGANEVAAPTNNDRPMAAGQPVATDKPKKTKVYKNRGVADAARKAAGNTVKVQKVNGGYILRPKTDAEIEAEAKNAKRLTARKTIDVQRDPLLVAIAKNGGLAPTEKADTIGEGNKLTRGGHVFRATGLPIDTMAEYLAEDGYIPPQEMERDGGTTWLRDAIKAEHMGSREHFSQRGEGWLEDRMAEMERQAQMDAEGDPFGTLADLTTEDLESSGYTQASPEVQALTEQLMADAEAAGIDTEAIRERVAMQNDGATADEYEAALQAAVRQALGQDRRGAEAGDARAEGAGNQDRGQADGGQEQGAGQGLTRQDRAALEAEYATRATEILQAISSRGDLPSLLRAGKARTADAFQSQPISDQAVAYADYIASGGKRVEFAESYNDRVRRLEREAATRRLQGDREIRQSNGKPFKTEASADQFRREYDLTSTHKVVPDGAGFMLRQLTMAEQDEAKRIADGRPTYEQAAAAVAADMGLTTNEDGEYNATDEQFAEYDRRITAILRGKEPMPEPKTAELLTTQTAEDLRAKAEREAAAAEDERRKRTAEQERLRKEAEDRDARARADQTVDDFQPGQSAEQQMSGVRDMFADAPQIDTTAERVDAEPAPQTDLIGFSQQETDQAAQDVETLRRNLIDLENRIIAAAGMSPDMLEDALRSRKVPAELKQRRQALRDQLRAAREQQAKAEAAPARAKRDDGRTIPQEGDKVYTEAGGFGGMPAVIRGEVRSGANGLFVAIEGAQGMLGEQAGRKRAPLSADWTLTGEEHPNARQRRESAERMEADAAKRKADREAMLNAAAAKNGTLDPATVKVGDTLELADGTRGTVTDVESYGIFVDGRSIGNDMRGIKKVEAKQSVREQEDPAKITEAEARARFEWRNLGQRDNTTTHGLYFDGMQYGRVTLFKGDSRFQIDDGEPQLTLKKAKAEAERVAVGKLVRDGYVIDPAAAQTEQPAPRSASTDAQAAPEEDWRARAGRQARESFAQEVERSIADSTPIISEGVAPLALRGWRDAVTERINRWGLVESETLPDSGNPVKRFTLVKGETIAHFYFRDQDAADRARALAAATAWAKRDGAPAEAVTDQPQDQPGTTGVGAGASRPVPAAQQAEPAAGLPLVTHTTAKGKVLEGYIVGVDKERAFELDKFTFRKDGGYFIRKARADELAPEVFAALPTPADAATAAQAAPATERQQQAAVEQAPEPKRQKTQVMRATAKRLIEAAQEDLGRDRNTNTARRAAMAGSAEADARKREAMGRTMLNLADAIDRGEAPLLEGVTTRAQVEALDTLLTAAMYESDRGLSYVEQQRQKGRAPEPRDVANAKLPQPSWNSGGANKESLREAIKGKKGVREVERMLFGPPTAELLAAVKAMGVTQKQIDYAFGWWSQEAIARKQRLARAGINTDEDLRAALSQYIAHRDGPKAEDPIKAAERRLIGQKVGFDFFPTPAAVAQRMVQMADIKAGDRVLEPSAGNGNIADAARAAGGTVDAVEISSQLRDLLEAKGHNLVGSDFMAYEPAEKYDAIVMNPPFSNRLDAEHIRRAFGMLKPGGRLVAIAGEGVFNGSDTKAKAFRDWLDENGAEVEPLPPGTFKDAQLLAQTGANARMIVLSAPEAQAAKQDAPAAKMRTYSWDAVKLADAYTLEQLDALRRQVQEQHANPGSSESGYTENGQPTLYLYDKAGRAKLDKISRAVTFKLQEAKAENAGGAMFSRAPAADPAKFPPIASLDGVSVGPMFVRPRPIAAGRPLYRETDIGGLDDLLRTEGEPGFSSIFVTDNRGLAIGQGDNRGVMVTFRPDSLSGAENRKPGTGDTTGREYRTDLVAPRAVQSVTMPKAELKRLRGLTKLRLRDFDQVENADGTVTFNRKGLVAPGGMFSRAPATDTPEFRRWFGDSKVVDAEGKPLVVYHGTNADFTKFNAGDGMLGRGIYFTPNAASALLYPKLQNMRAEKDGRKSGAVSVMPVFVSLQNPLVLNELPASKVDAAKVAAQGFDGIVLLNADGSVKELTAFRPEQIKSAIGNVGTFDTANPDIRMSRATGAGLPLADAQASVAAIREAMPSAPPIDVHATLEDAPAELQGIIRRAGAANDVEGVYWQGRIHVFPQHIASRERLEFVVGHHEVRHHGLAALLGDERAPLMRRLYATNKAVREAADAYLKANPFADKATAVEEALADMPVERVQSLRGWQRIVAAIRDGLRRFADTIRDRMPGLAAAIEPAEWTDADITALVRRAEDVSRAPAQQSAPDMEPAPMFSRRPQRDDVTAEAPATDAIDPTMRRGWIDRIGRVQSAPGQALYNLIGRAASPLLLKTGLKAASPELRRMLRAMRLDVQKAQDVAVAVAREGTKLSDAERAMVSDIVEKEIAAGTIPPEHAVRLAEAMSAAMTRQSGELVSLGMLSDSAAQRWDGKYLPRYYESKLRPKVADAWADALMRITRRASPLKGIRGKHLKGRGLFETIPAGALQDYLDLGWEVRDDGYKPGQSAEVQVWRDFTREEREKMGEIRDAVFRFVMGYMQTQRDIALGRMFQTLALDERHSSRLPRDGWVKVPETVVEGTGVRRYGMLSGRYVPQEVLSHLSQIEETDSAAWQLYRRALGIWKMGKTVLNPVAHANNIISNLTMAHFGGVSYHRADKYVGAIRDIASRGPLFQEARENGLFLSTMSAAEMMNTMPDELQELVAKAESKTERGAKLVFDLMTWFLRKPMGKAYEAEDLFFRFLLYREARSGGMEPQDAVDYAQRYIFTYDDLPKGARMIRDFALPFFAYTYKAIPALLHTATVYPHRFIAPAGVLWAANAIGYAIATGDDDDDWWETVQKYISDPEFRKKAQEKEKLEREFLPPWQKGSSALLTPKAIRLGMDELTNLPLFLDASRMIPGGDLFDVSPNAGGLPLPQPLTPSHPLLTVATGMLGNRDLFTGKDLVDKNDDAGEAAAKRSDWLWKQASPAITINNYHWERLMQAAAHANGGPIEWVPDVIGGEATGVGRDGLPVQPKYAAAQTFGIKVRPFDQKRSQDMEAGKKAQLIRGIEAEMRQLERLGKIGALSPQSVFDKKSKLMDKRDKIRAGEPEETTQ